MLTAKGIPAILQGTEWLEDDGWENNRLDWSLKTVNSGVFAFYQDLIGIRTGERAMYANSPLDIVHLNDGGDVLAFERFEAGGKSFVVVANLSPNDYTDYLIGMPRAGTWGVAINSDRVAYDGDGFGSDGVFQTEPIGRDGYAQRATLSIPGYGLLVLEHEPADDGCTIADLADPRGVLDLADIAVFVTAFNNGELAADLAEPIGVIDLADISAFVVSFTAGCP